MPEGNYLIPSSMDDQYRTPRSLKFFQTAKPVEREKRITCQNSESRNKSALHYQACQRLSGGKIDSHCTSQRVAVCNNAIGWNMQFLNQVVVSKLFIFVRVRL